MADETFERFLSPADRATAVVELAAKGDEAVLVLLRLFSGEAKNDFGSPYKDIGATNCGFEAAMRLGPKAKLLESHLREGALAGYDAAVIALGNLENLDRPSEEALVEVVRTGRFIPQSEAVAALFRHGLGAHPVIAEYESRYPGSRGMIARLRLEWARP